MAQTKNETMRISKHFRTAFDFLNERARTLQNVGNTAAFWDATNEIMTFKANQAENDELLIGLFAVCHEELEAQARTMQRKWGGVR